LISYDVYNKGSVLAGKTQIFNISSLNINGSSVKCVDFTYSINERAEVIH